MTIRDFVTWVALIGAAVFLAVWGLQQWGVL
jgi:hypothetical protein